MKALVLVNNNLNFDTRNKTQITAIAQQIEEVHVLVRPIPGETFDLNLPNVTHSFFHYEAKQHPITPAIRESAKQLGVYDDLIEVCSLLKYDDYYNPIVIQQFVDDLNDKMQGDRWAEIRRGICEPMDDNIAISYPLNLFEVGTQWAQEVIKIPADVVLCNNIDTLLCGVAHKIKYGSRLIYDSPDIYCDVKPGVFPRIYRYVLALFENLFAKYADVMLGASVGHLKWFKNHYSLKIPCIPVYSCTVENNDAPFEPKKPQEKLRIYYHGMIYDYKDFKSIIEAMRQVNDVSLVLRCWPSEHLEKVKRLVEENDLTQRVRYLEPVAAPEIASAARQDGDIGIFVCETENDLNFNLTLSNKFIEYLRAGLPIILSPLEEQAKIVEKYQCGYVLKDNSVESMVAVFNQAIAEREQLYKMSENSLKASKELFDWQTHKKTLLAVIMGDQQTIEEKAKEVGDSAMSLSYDMQDMERKLLKLNEYNKALEANKKALEADKNALEADNKALETDKNALETDKKALEADNKSLEADNKALEADNKALETDKKALEADNKALETDKKALEADKNALEADKKALEENKIILLQTIDTLEVGTKSLDGQIETIQSNLELVLNSNSWKITKPLRAFRKILTK